ncbi:hypothetical protein ACIRU5_09560 [Streptomyces misionensis]
MRPGSRAVRAGIGPVSPLRGLRVDEQVDVDEIVVRPTVRR